MSSKLITIFVLMILMNMVDTLAYSARLAGVGTKRVAMAYSIFNMTSIVSRLANLFLLPLTGSIVDTAIKTGQHAGVESQFRLILLGAAAGTFLGMILIPAIGDLITAIIFGMERKGSLFKVIVSGFHPRNIIKAIKLFRFPKKEELNFSLKNLPQLVLFLNPVIIAIFQVGILGSIYAGVLIPEYRLTASQLSGMINGFATILLLIFVDPTSAMVVDEAVNEKRPYREVLSCINNLALGRFVGTILAQVIFVPASYAIVYATKLLIR